ncbi:MAG: hypothetical protein IKJ65_07920 [Clostridia bacterium]|nr:hypothetical protein [Clostridia bacterium]
MKKMTLILLALIFFILPAHAEETPDGSVNTVYFPFFEKDALVGFQYVLYPEKSGLLLSAYSETAEIAVTAEQSETADARDFLADYVEGMTRYAALLNEPEILPWEVGGAQTRIVYRHNKAADEEEAYTTDAFVSKVEEGMYLLIVFNSWLNENEQALIDAQEKFFASFRLESIDVSDAYLAQVKNARSDDEGNQYVTVDFCSVMYDASIFTVYAQNMEEKSVEYKLSKDALIWSYDPEASLYTQVLIAPAAENLVEISAHYYESMGFDVIFRILFDTKGEIIWMMHYNAF